MEYQIEKKDDGSCRLSCSFASQEVLAAWKKASEPFAATFRMSGFRPGKVPPEVLERHFFSQISEDATDRLVERAVNDICSGSELIPVSVFRYEGENARRGQGFSFSVEFCVLEDGKLPDLEAVCVKEEEAQADPVQESLFIRDILSRKAVKSAVAEGCPQDGDTVDIEVTGKLNGRPVPGMKTGVCRMRLMPVRPGEKVPDLDPVVRGLHVGETGTGVTPCPDNYPDPSMRGKNIDLVVTLRGIERESLPPLDDATARSLGFHDAAALKRSAHARALEMDRVHRASEARRALRDKLEQWEGFDAPEALVRQCRGEIMHHSRQYLQSQFDSADTLKKTLALMREEAEATAVRKARARALLLGWARSRGLEISGNELERVIGARAARRNMSVADYRRSVCRTGELFELRAAMLEDRALSELMKIVIRPADRA